MAFSFPPFGQLHLEGYQEAVDPKLDRTPMDSGPAKQAKSFSRTNNARSLTYTFTAAEFVAFKQWWRLTVSSGSDWFNWVDPVSGNATLVRMIGGKYMAKAVSANQGNFILWEVNFTIEGWEF